MPQIIDIADIPGLTSNERKLLAAWRETYGRHAKNHRNPDKFRLMMLTELVPIGGGMSMLKCHHISGRPICIQPID